MAAVMSPATSNFQQNDVTLHVINMYLQTFVWKSDAAKLLPASISISTRCKGTIEVVTELHNNQKFWMTLSISQKFGYCLISCRGEAWHYRIFPDFLNSGLKMASKIEGKAKVIACS